MMSPLPSSYSRARASFINAAKRADARLKSLPYFESDDDLACDIAEFGASDAPALLVLSSGAHGAEGYVGSAIQTAALSTQLPKNCRIVMVHAVNPWGMAHWSRTDADGIDVNRNFVDHSGPPRGSDAYDLLADYFHVDEWDLSERRTAYSALAEVATEEALNAFAAGQFHRPDGLYYGGAGPGWSRRALEPVIGPLLQGPERILWIDWHSGIGSYGERVVLNFAEPGSDVDRLARECCASAGGTWPAPASLSRYEGLLIHGMARLAPADTVFAGLVMEFGTGDDFHVFRADCLDRYLSHQGRNTPNYDRLRQDYARAYFPQDLDWQSQLLSEGEKVISTALQALSKTETD